MEKFNLKNFTGLHNFKHITILESIYNRIVDEISILEQEFNFDAKRHLVLTPKTTDTIGIGVTGRVDAYSNAKEIYDRMFVIVKKYAKEPIFILQPLS
jgi:hypothetical protein